MNSSESYYRTSSAKESGFGLGSHTRLTVHKTPEPHEQFFPLILHDIPAGDMPKHVRSLHQTPYPGEPGPSLSACTQKARLSGSGGNPGPPRYRRTRVSPPSGHRYSNSHPRLPRRTRREPRAPRQSGTRHLNPATRGARLSLPFLPPAAAEPSLPQHLAHRLQHHLAAQSGLGALRVDGPFGGQAALIPDHGPAERGAAGHGSAHRGLSPLSPAAPPAPPRQWAAGGGCSARPAPLRLPPGRQLPSGARSRCLGPEVRGDTPAEVIRFPVRTDLRRAPHVRLLAAPPTARTCPAGGCAHGSPMGRFNRTGTGTVRHSPEQIVPRAPLILTPLSRPRTQNGWAWMGS